MSPQPQKKALPAWSEYVTLLGMSISGDLDGMTVYTTKQGKIVFYPASPALKPPSDLQRKQRLRFRIAQQNWMGLSSSDKASWETLTRKFSLPLTGQNLFISLSLNPQNDKLASALARANLSLATPTPIPL